MLTNPRYEGFHQKIAELVPAIEAAISPLLDGVDSSIQLGLMSAICVRALIRATNQLTDSEKQVFLNNRILLASMQLSCLRATTAAILEVKSSAKVLDQVLGFMASCSKHPDTTAGDPPASVEVPVPVAGGNDEGPLHQQ